MTHPVGQNSKVYFFTPSESCLSVPFWQTTIDRQRFRWVMRADSIRQYILAMKSVRDNPDAVRSCAHFLEAAKPFTRVKWGLSKEYAWLHDSESQPCFESCQRIAERISRLRYFEGYVSVGELVEDHAWLVDETGEVIDPTRILLPKPREGVEGYRGLEIPMRWVNGHFTKDRGRDTRIEQAFIGGQW